MRFAPYVLAALLAGTVAGCGYHTETRYAYTSDAYAPAPVYYSSAPRTVYYSSAPAPVYYASSYDYPSSRYGYTSRWDYYRNYQGSTRPGPEVYP